MPSWRNSDTRYGWVAVGLHGLGAVLVFTLFGLGLWMVELTYYDSWYHRAPALHKTLGVLLFVLTALRLAWRWSMGVPRELDSHTGWERSAARLMHILLYALLFASMFSGYLMVTADGHPLEVFGGLGIPATLTGITDQEDVAGAAHLALAITLMGAVVLHAGAAVKHHFVDRDSTLLRMLGIAEKQEKNP